ncbi:T9SS-dependent M36 family metallopeptidase [Pontibacter sp. CAU 1760]
MGKNLYTYKRLAIVVAMLFGTTYSYGQGQLKSEKRAVPQVAVDHIKNSKQKLELLDEDIADLELSSETFSKKSGMRHLYIKQLYQGIEVHGAVSNISFDKSEKVVTTGNRFHKEIGKKVKSDKAQLDAEAAVAAAAAHLQTALKEPLTVKERGNGLNKEVLFSTGGISLEPIPAKLVYQPMEDGSLVLAWEVSVYELDAQNWWNLRIDANTGKVLDKDNMVVHCSFDNDGPGGQPLHDNHSHTTLPPYVASTKAQVASTSLANSYSVFAMPLESPNHGPRTGMSTLSADKAASPSGWHYTPYGNMTNTRGNNVYAYEDPTNLNPFPTIANNFTVNNYSPDGGADLNFNFPVDFTQQPETYKDAAITNLFYWNNLIHDVWYQYGFDEVSGNFQFDNFNKGGKGNDFVRAEAQDSRIGASPQRNNANFGTPVDGLLPRMQMYLWNGIPDRDMARVTAPANIAGSYPAIEAIWSKKLTPTPLNGKLVLAETADPNSAEGCSAFTNAAAISGNIAVVYRGSCGFLVKAEQAQAAGAIALVVINSVPGAPIAMGGTPAPGVTIQIPAVMISQANGKIITDVLSTSTPVMLALKNDGSGPEIDGDFDNGIIVHEYGHGISNRLTGGPNMAGCLSNAEQMGEGWSDWFGLMMTMKPGDLANKVRGIGTYASGEAVTGRGIRPAPYSTDFGINNYTYAATNSAALAAPHGVGFVWATMLWDMTWAFIDKYGFDEDLYNGKGGNNMAMQLVIDGLKLQKCSPGFVDGRNAILEADLVNYNGAHQEMIWRVFAKRGLGFSASQGSNLSRFDQVEALDVPPMYACAAPTIAFQKSSNVYTGGNANTIYLGYGAQSILLQASGDETFTYTWNQVAGLRSTSNGNAIFTPTEAGNYTLTVNAVNRNDCRRSASVDIRVIDAREIKHNNAKIYVCHNGVNIVVANTAVAAHLEHGDQLATCNLSAAATSAAAAADFDENFVTSYPNPFSESTNIRFTAKESGHTVLKVYDITGREVATLFEGNAERGMTYTKSFKASDKQAGLYVYRLVNGGSMKSGTMLLMK